MVIFSQAAPTKTMKNTRGPGSLQISITKMKNSFNDYLSKRDHVKISLEHAQDLYYAATLEIGTPIQEITVVFDSGSSDLWVMSSKNPFCLPTDSSPNYQNQTYDGELIVPSVDCSNISTYDANLSSTYKSLEIGRFFINYTDETFADGSWGNEKMVIDGSDISTLQFAVADYATSPVGGVLGIGFPRRESVEGYDDAPDSFYPNFPQVLKNEGLIETVTYSMFLNDPSSDTGSILFGAIDLTKFDGPLYTFPMVNVYPDIVKVPATLTTTLQGMGAQSKQRCEQKTFTTTKFPVLLDSGTSLMSAPQDIVEEMAAFVNASYSDSDGIYILDCPAADDDTEYVFDFGDIQITVPLSSLILLPPEDGLCGFGVQPTSDTMVLGDIFLSSAYVVFDLDHHQISLAQAKWEDTPSEQTSIVQIPENGNIPGATTATATPWSTYEAFSVTSNIFEGTAVSCLPTQSQNASSSPIQSTATISGPMINGTNSESAVPSSYSSISSPSPFISFPSGSLTTSSAISYSSSKTISTVSSTSRFSDRKSTLVNSESYSRDDRKLSSKSLSSSSMSVSSKSSFEQSIPIQTITEVIYVTTTALATFCSFSS